MLALQENMLEHQIRRHSSVRIGIAEDPWLFTLGDDMCIEDHYFETTPVDKLTKMALAKFLQRRDGLSNAERNHHCNTLPKAALQAAMLPAAALPAPAPAAAGVAARGRGRGRGRGKGRGKH